VAVEEFSSSHAACSLARLHPLLLDKYLTPPNLWFVAVFCCGFGFVGDDLL